MNKRTNKYTSHEVQNDLLKVMALNILMSVGARLHDAMFFTIMADETTDASNREQVTIILRWVDDADFSVHEEFVGLYTVPWTDSNALASIIKDALVRLNLPLSKATGQCYDGAANMSGIRNGIAAQLSKGEAKAVYIHCYGHSLNVAAADTIKSSKVMKPALDTIHEISKLVKYSPHRDVLFEGLKSQLLPDSPGIRTLCAMRWTV